MSELVDRIAANVGLDRAVAEKAIGIILDFLSKEGPADKVSALIARLPGSEALLQAARDEDNGGLFGGMGGIMGVGARLMGAGLDMGQIQAVTGELMAYSRERGVGDTLGEIAGAIPGLGQFI
ncbi:MAG TPA: DUF2267 domain-containing protein [Xanthobacteraceae bacterium]|jgi:hypothetical protein|nr:DUF2267 domain-containing protein [Xanthobacteraceae bacterium]